MIQITTTNTSFAVQLPEHGSKTRLISTSETAIGPDKTNKCFDFFTKYCCYRCYHSQRINQNQIAAKIFAKYLIQEYGHVTSLLSQRVTQIDLNFKETHGSSLHSNEAQLLIEKAKHLKTNIKILKRMIHQIAFYNEFRMLSHKLRRGPSNGSSLKEEGVIRDRTKSTAYSTCSVLKSNNRFENFNKQKIVKTLMQLTLSKPLEENQASEIASAVKKKMKEDLVGQIASNTIREYVANALAEHGYAVNEPEFIAMISNKLIRESIINKKHLEDLFGIECAELLEQAESYKNTTISIYPLTPKSE